MLKRFAVAFLVIGVLCLAISILCKAVWAGGVESLRIEKARLINKIQGYNRTIQTCNQLIADTRIRLIEIQGIEEWEAQKDAEAQAEKIKAEIERAEIIEQAKDLLIEEEPKENADAPSTEK